MPLFANTICCRHVQIIIFIQCGQRCAHLLRQIFTIEYVIAANHVIIEYVIAVCLGEQSSAALRLVGLLVITPSSALTPAVAWSRHATGYGAVLSGSLVQLGPATVSHVRSHVIGLLVAIGWSFTGRWLIIMFNCSCPVIRHSMSNSSQLVCLVSSWLTVRPPIIIRLASFFARSHAITRLAPAIAFMQSFYWLLSPRQFMSGSRPEPFQCSITPLLNSWLIVNYCRCRRLGLLRHCHALTITFNITIRWLLRH